MKQEGEQRCAKNDDDGDGDGGGREYTTTTSLRSL